MQSPLKFQHSDNTFLLFLSFFFTEKMAFPKNTLSFTIGAKCACATMSQLHKLTRGARSALASQSTPLQSATTIML